MVLRFKDFVNEAAKKVEPTEVFQWYAGVADCLGIDCLFLINDEVYSEAERRETLSQLGLDDDDTYKETQNLNQVIGQLVQRAHANMQRHPVVFKAKMEKTDGEMVMHMFHNGQNEEALNFVKGLADTIQLARVGGLNAEKTWNRIPNKELNPI